jgi:hypothetical protein
VVGIDVIVEEEVSIARVEGASVVTTLIGHKCNIFTKGKHPKRHTAFKTSI